MTVISNFLRKEACANRSLINAVSVKKIFNTEIYMNIAICSPFEVTAFEKYLLLGPRRDATGI